MYAEISCRPGRSAFNCAGGHPEAEAIVGLQQQLKQATEAGVRLMIINLSPPEKGFFVGTPHGRIDKEAIRHMASKLQHEGSKAALEWLQKVAGHEADLTDSYFLQPLRLSETRLRHLQNGHYDYFRELIDEYRFYVESNQQTSSFRLLKPTEALPQGDQTSNLFAVFAIGGIHSLGIGNTEDDYLRPGEPRSDVRIGTLKQRIRQLKGEEPLDDGTFWAHRPLYITLAQHFNNTLFGHASSLPAPASLLYHQGKHLGQGVQRPHGLDVIKELLGLSIDLSVTNSKRILIDVSHLSAAARLDYYKHIIRPFNQKHAHKQFKIPVIASRTAYSGIDLLEELMLRERQETSGRAPRENGFVANSLNVTDEDVIEIFHSRGLLGLTLDKHQLGAEEPMRWWKLTLKSEAKVSWHALKRNLRQLVAIPFAYGLDGPLQIWDRLCISTGFEQVTSPLERYNNVQQMATLETDLVKILEHLHSEEPLWLGSYRPERLARKLCYENVVEFVKRNY